MTERNQTPEQLARDKIDALLKEAGWHVQPSRRIDFNAGLGIAVREYQTDIGPADYVLFVDKKAVGVIEAKPEDWGHRITTVEQQSGGYASATLKWVNNQEPLPFVYESTGVITRFTDGRDPKPRSREIFNFPCPETLREWLAQPVSLRGRLQTLPPLNHQGLRDCQIKAIEQLEHSFKEDRPRALVQMATGSGKTFTAITSAYRLLKHADAKRILFLVDTRNLGEQAEQEFMAYVPNDDNRKFTELYNVQRLKSRHLPPGCQVYISTIQRMYSILKDEEMDEAAEAINPAEMVQPKKAMPVVYNPKEAENGRIDVSQIRKFGEVKKGYTPFQKGDVLFAKITPCMENGKMAVVPDLHSGVGFGSTEFHVLRAHQGIEPQFLYYFVSSKTFRYDAGHNMTGAVGQKRVPTAFLERCNIPLPTTYEQRRIVAKIEELFSELDKGIESLRTAREQLKIYRQAVLKHAFDGQLTAPWREENQDKLETADQLLARIQQEREAHYQRQLEEWEATFGAWEAEGKEGNKPAKPSKPKTVSVENISLPTLPNGWAWEHIGSGLKTTL